MNFEEFLMLIILVVLSVGYGLASHWYRKDLDKFENNKKDEAGLGNKQDDM